MGAGGGEGMGGEGNKGREIGGPTHMEGEEVGGGESPTGTSLPHFRSIRTHTHMNRCIMALPQEQLHIDINSSTQPWTSSDSQENTAESKTMGSSAEIRHHPSNLSKIGPTPAPHTISLTHQAPQAHTPTGRDNPLRCTPTHPTHASGVPMQTHPLSASRIPHSH
jgi:hypothetical protein